MRKLQVQISQIKKAFDFKGFFIDEGVECEDGTIFCRIHKEYYKAIPTGNYCFKKYKNCPKCEAETNYRIAKKAFNDAVNLNRLLIEAGQPTHKLPELPDKPEWWSLSDEWHFGDGKKSISKKVRGAKSDFY